MAGSAWVYNKATGIFLRGGFSVPFFDAETEGVWEFPDDDPHPDLRLTRFDPELGKRPATPEEIEAYDAAKFNADVAAAVGQNPLVAAVGLTLETRRIGREMTPEEQQALLGEVAMRYQALRGSQG